MYNLLRDARAVVFLFEALAESYVRAYPGALDPAKIHIIPNGFEGTIEESVPKRQSCCTIAYTGTLSTYRFDTLLHSLQRLLDSDPTTARRLRFRFVGDHTTALADAVRAHGLTDLVAIEPSVPHATVREIQASADVLLLLGRDSTRRGHELVAGAKLFEYLRMRRPILAILPRDEGARILNRVGAPTVCDVESPAEIVAMLESVAGHWANGTLTELLPDRRACEAFSAATQTAALVRALEGASSATPFVPGSVEIPPSLQADGCVRSFG